MPWLQLTFYSTKDDAEQLGDLLSECGAAAVTLQDAADQPLYEPPRGTTPLWQLTNVVGLFEDSYEAESVVQQLAAQWDSELPDYRSEILQDQAWERTWMDDFKPMRFGQRLWIIPSWSEPSDPDATNIFLDPGLAFGTGTHPTTRLCLEWLDSHDVAGKTVIDYGCGSGILAIAAALLGAKAVVGVDNDPQALLATMENARRNEVNEKITCYLPKEAPEEPAELLLANILAGPLMELAPHLAKLVISEGSIVLSGILPEQAEAVSEAYAPWFEMQPVAEHDGWIRLGGTKKPQ